MNLDCDIPDSFIVEVYIGTEGKNFKVFLERAKQATMARYGGIVRLAPIFRLASKAGVESNTPTKS
jgi:hypothetical protein